MGPTPMYGAGAEKPLQKADFATKQTNICRLSGDINTNGTFYGRQCMRSTVAVNTVNILHSTV